MRALDLVSHSIWCAPRFPSHETLEALSPLARVQEVAQMLARATADAASHEHEVCP